MILEDRYTPPECRSIMTGGHFVGTEADRATAQRKAAEAASATPEAVVRTREMPVGVMRMPQAKPNPVGRPRTRPVVAPREPPPGLNRMGKILAITPKAIHERLKSGMDIRAIAEEFGCCRSLINRRLNAADGPAKARELKCPTCTRRKHRYAPSCGICRRNARRRVTA